MTFQMQCPRCGQEFSGENKDSVADVVVDHARVGHAHNLDREVVLAHLEGVSPHDRDG